METKIGLFDLDNSLFDFEGAMLEALQTMRSPHESEIINLWDNTDPWIESRMEFVKSSPGWWRNLKPLENGFRIFRMAQEIGFQCEILTKGPRTKSVAWAEKLECCQQHLGIEVDVHITSGREGKGQVYGNFFYDDYIPFMESWLKWRHRGLGIMPLHKSNINFDHPNVIKWNGNNYHQVREALRRCYERKSGEPLNISDLK